MTGLPPVRLTGKQRRGISTTLALLDEALCDIEQWAAGRQLTSVLYSERNALSSDQRQALRTEVENARLVLAELQERLGLSRSMQDVEQAIWSRCAVLRTQLLELEARRLRRYGSVSQELAGVLATYIEQLLRTIDAILDVVTPSKTSTEPDSTAPGPM